MIAMMLLAHFSTNLTAYSVIQQPKMKPPPIYKQGADFTLYVKRFHSYLGSVKIPPEECKNHFLQNVDNRTYEIIHNMGLEENLKIKKWIKVISKRFGEKIGDLGSRK